jgi:hypothetical protein
MNMATKLAAATLAAASATVSFATGNTWPGLLAVAAAGLIVLNAIRWRKEES